jgi:glycosyltransferase involved in cell wall biosynthesis
MLEEPLVSVVTPVYNGEAYLAECIESVLAQTYSNWDYTIVDNCSSDGTHALAEKYTRSDNRIIVHRNDEFLDIIGNHNKAFRLISSDSKYCKVVSADDWLFPECLARMTALAEANPSVGIVGSYQLSGGGNKWYLRTDGLPCDCTVVSGREIGRMHLLGVLDVLGNPTSTLYRSDLVRSAKSFYPNSSAEADASACFKCLRDCDFGFVHQVLSYERIHPDRITTTSQAFNAYVGSKLNDLSTYGLSYLSPAEIDCRLQELLGEYYKFLAISAVNFQDRKFWKYHKKRLQDLGYPLNRARLAGTICMKLADLLFNPKQTIEKVLRRRRPRTTRGPASTRNFRLGISKLASPGTEESTPDPLGHDYHYH